MIMNCSITDMKYKSFWNQPRHKELRRTNVDWSGSLDIGNTSVKKYHSSIFSNWYFIDEWVKHSFRIKINPYTHLLLFWIIFFVAIISKLFFSTNLDYINLRTHSSNLESLKWYSKCPWTKKSFDKKVVEEWCWYSQPLS